jgi:hypothetical protein
MENFPRSSEPDISISSIPASNPNYYAPQVPHSAPNPEQAGAANSQYVSDRLPAPGMMSSVSGYANMNNGHVNQMPTHIRSNSPNVIG